MGLGKLCIIKLPPLTKKPDGVYMCQLPSNRHSQPYLKEKDEDGRVYQNVLLRTRIKYIAAYDEAISR